MKKIITDDYEFEHIIGGKAVYVDKTINEGVSVLKSLFSDFKTRPAFICAIMI